MIVLIKLFDIRHFLHRFAALTSSRGPKRKWTSSDALGFCMCFFSLACRGHNDRKSWKERKTDEQRWRGEELWYLTKRLRASFSFCRLSITSASEGGLARRVNMPSVNKQSNNDHTQTPELPALHADLLQTGCRFHFMAKVYINAIVSSLLKLATFYYG